MFTCLLVRALVLACKPSYTRHFTTKPVSPVLLVPLEHRFHTGRAKQSQKCKLYILVQFACPLLRGPPRRCPETPIPEPPDAADPGPSPRSRRLVRGSVCVITSTLYSLHPPFPRGVSAVSLQPPGTRRGSKASTTVLDPQR